MTFSCLSAATSGQLAKAACDGTARIVVRICPCNRLYLSRICCIYPCIRGENCAHERTHLIRITTINRQPRLAMLPGPRHVRMRNTNTGRTGHAVCQH